MLEGVVIRNNTKVVCQAKLEDALTSALIVLA